MTEKQKCVDLLQEFLDRIYGQASREQGGVLSRNCGHYDYAGDKFSVYVTVFPEEIELVFEGEQVEGGSYVVSLDICTPEGEMLKGKVVSAKGGCDEIRKTLERSEASVLAELLRFLNE
ncbi:hypothetical protein [Pseudomonas allokribbensis]|uniref:hypothetical protein n=1 Tax=Pseudomonas allokribbensis TaxID=2774460 RepID=UPI00178864EB|nr:hypothetical protein [Pseudomonas allokribbensis]